MYYNKKIAVVFLKIFIILLLSSPIKSEAKNVPSYRFAFKYPAQEKPAMSMTPNHIAFDNKGNLYIADPPNSRIVSLKTCLGTKWARRR